MLDLLGERRQIDGLGTAYTENLVDTRGFERLAIAYEFLRELLSGTQPDELDRNLLIRHESRQPNQVPGDVEHLDLLTHVEHECFTLSCENTSLQYQLHGFGDRHEVAPDLRMCHRDWPARTDLI